jgi:hypothetical protein
MKRISIFTLTLMMVLALAACGGQSGASANGDAGNSGGAENDVGGQNNGGAENDGGTPQAADTSANGNINISFAQEGDFTLITIISPYVSQFTEEALKLPEEEIYQASFSVHFNNQDDWEQGFGVSFGHQHSYTYVDNQEVATYTTRGHFNQYANDLYLSSGEGGLVVEVDGDKAEWYISGVELSLDNITDVSINAGLMNEISDPDDYLFFDSIQIAQVAVSDTVPVADVTALPFDVTGMYAGENYENEADNAIFYVNALPGGYEISIGDFTTGPLQPEIRNDEYGDYISFQSNTPDGYVSASFSSYIGDTAKIGASLDRGDASGATVYLNGGKVYLHPGTLMTWDSENQTTKTAMTYEFEDGKFRFSITDGEYTSDWLEPDVSSYSLGFTFISGGVEFNVVIRNINSILDQSIDIEKLTNGAHDSTVYAYPEITKEDVAGIDFTGTYDENGDPERTLVISQDTVTVAGRFTCERDDAAFFNSRWKPMTLTDQTSGEKIVVETYISLDYELNEDGMAIPGSIAMSKKVDTDDSLEWYSIWLMPKE